MTRFRVNSNKKNVTPLIATVMSGVMGALILNGCTKVDDRLGGDLVPGNQQMSVHVKHDFPAIKRHLYRRTDGVASSRTGWAVIGRANDPTFGRQTGSALLQFQPASVPYSGIKGYGINPIVDSAVIMLAFADIKGDSLATQNFEVWDIEGEYLPHDSTFYSDFNIGAYRKNKLFTFSRKGRRDVRSRLMPTAEGRRYLDSIVRIHNWDDYLKDSLFRRKFQGLFIRPADDADGALFTADLTKSGFALYVRNHDTLDTSAIYDTLATSFTFRDVDAPATSTTYAVAYNNVSINFSEFDYTGSLLDGVSISDTLPDAPSLTGQVYVQSGGGVGTMLRFPKEFVDAVKALKDSGKDVLINQAMLTMPIADQSVAGMDESIARIGSYLDSRKLTSTPDYLYAYEAYQRSQSSTSNYSLPYGGYLNRSKGVYEFNMTSYIQRLAMDKIHNAIYLGPAAYSVFGSGQTVLTGEVGVRITYTIID